MSLLKYFPYVSPQTLGQFFRFSAVGLLNALIDFAVYLSLTRLTSFGAEHRVLATVVAFLVASLNGYFFNKYWSFRHTTGKHHIQYSKFMLTMTVGLCLNALIFQGLTAYLGVHDIWAKCIVAGIILFWNFSINKLWTFKSLPPTDTNPV